MEAPTLEGKKLVFASVLRAGNGLLEGLLDLVPAARVAHIGLYRDHETLEAVEYFFKAPSDLGDRLVIVVDPMLATANSAIAAIDKLKGRGATNLRYLCLLAAPEGIERFTKAHPDVPVFTAAIDSSSTRRAISCPASATPATACTGRSRRAPLPFVNDNRSDSGRLASRLPMLSAVITMAGYSPRQSQQGCDHAAQTCHPDGVFAGTSASVPILYQANPEAFHSL